MLKPNEIRARAALGVFVLLVLSAIALCISCILQLRGLSGYTNGEPFDLDYFLRCQQVHFIMQVVIASLGIAAMIVFILWFRRAYWNMHQLTTDLSYSEGWAAAAWFVPFVNLVRPVQIMSDMERESRELLANNNILSAGNMLKRLIVAWWMLWILRMLGNMLLNGFYRNDGEFISYDMLVKGLQNQLVMAALDLLLLAVTIAMIRAYAKREKLLPLLGTRSTERLFNESDLLDD